MLPRTVALHFPMVPVRALLAPGHLLLRNASRTTRPPSLIHPFASPVMTTLHKNRRSRFPQVDYIRKFGFSLAPVINYT